MKNQYDALQSIIIHDQTSKNSQRSCAVPSCGWFQRDPLRPQRSGAPWSHSTSRGFLWAVMLCLDQPPASAPGGGQAHPSRIRLGGSSLEVQQWTILNHPTSISRWYAWCLIRMVHKAELSADELWRSVRSVQPRIGKPLEGQHWWRGASWCTWCIHR